MNLGFGEMAFIFMIALIIFGPKKLPEIGRQIGKALNEFKRASNEFKAQIEAEISQLETKSEPQILPPAYPPVGSIAAHSVQDAPVVPEITALPEGEVMPEAGIVRDAPALPEGEVIRETAALPEGEVIPEGTVIPDATNFAETPLAKAPDA